MTIAKYATKGIDHLFNAKLRCVKKYGNNPDLRQGWMDDWTDDTIGQVVFGDTDDHGEKGGLNKLGKVM